MSRSQDKQVQETKNNTAAKPKRHKWLKWTTGILVGLYVVSLFVPFISGYTQFPLQVVRCGRLPVAASDFAAAYSYNIPSSKNYRIDFATDHYFCSESEARSAGYHRDVLVY